MGKFENFEQIDSGIVDDAAKKRILEHRERDFNNPVSKFEPIRNEKGKIIEMEKTAEQLKIIQLANDATNQYLEKYGLPSLDVLPERIHILERGYSDKNYYVSENKEITISDDSKVFLLEKIVHEMLHLKSKQRFRFVPAKVGHGFVMDKKSTGIVNETQSGRVLFKNLNEAITEEISKKICLELFENELFDDEKQKFQEIVKNGGWKRDEKIVENMESGEYFEAHVAPYDNSFLKGLINIIKRKKKDKKIDLFGFVYRDERNILNELIDKIFEYNNRLDDNDKKEFNLQSREDVFEVFAESMMRGDLRKVIKLIDHTFGLGTTQKLLAFENSEKDGKSFNDIGGQLEFVKKLEPKLKEDGKK